MTTAAGPTGGAEPIGAVVLYYDRGPDVIGTLETLLAQTRPPDVVVLVDNASPTRPVAGLDGLPDGVEVVHSPVNRGYAGGMNEAVARLPATVTRVLLLTHDVRLDEGCVAALARALDDDDHLGLVGPLIGRRGAPAEVYSAGGEYRGRARRPDHVRVPSRVEDWAGEAVRPAAWLDGCALMARRDAFDGIGGLDPTFFLYVEDIDLSERMRAAGWGVAVAPQARVWEESAGTNPASYLASRLEVHRRHHGRATLATTLVSETVVALRQLVDPRPNRSRSGRLRVRQIVRFARSRVTARRTRGPARPNGAPS